MRVFMLSLFFLSLVCRVSAQISVVQMDRGYIAYVGIEHTIGIAVEGYPSTALIVTVDNGTIDRHYIAGQYTITPKYPGDSLTITVQAKTKTGIKEVKKFRVKLECIPIESTTFMGYTSGARVSVGLIKVATSLDWSHRSLEFDNNFRVTGCDFSLKRNDVIVFSKHIYDQRGLSFSSDEEIEEAFQSVEPGDVLTFTNITYFGFGECTGTMKYPIEITAN